MVLEKYNTRGLGGGVFAKITTLWLIEFSAKVVRTKVAGTKVVKFKVS